MAPSVPLHQSQLAEPDSEYDGMKPEDLFDSRFDLWLSPKKDSIQNCNLAAVFNVNYSSIAGSIVRVTASGGEVSKFVISDGAISVGERMYTGDLRILLYALFRIYKSATLGILKIKFNKSNIFHRMKSQLEPLSMAKDGLRCRRFELEYANQQRVSLEPLYGFLRDLKVEEKIDFGVNALEFPYEILEAAHVNIRNGDRIPFKIFEMNFKKASISNSPWNDWSFNLFIHEWLESKNERLEMLVISASSIYNRKTWDYEGLEYLLEGLEVEVRTICWNNLQGETVPSGLSWRVRRSDGAVADFVRTRDEFLFKVHKADKYGFESQGLAGEPANS